MEITLIKKGGAMAEMPIKERISTIKRIRWQIFLPPWLIAIAILMLNITNYDLFSRGMACVIQWILHHFSWLLNLTTFLCVIIVMIAYFSPLKNIRIGGAKSEPLLSYPNYIWVVLCTIMGSGLMLWACAEPMYHLYFPPANITAGACSGEAVMWAMENILLEWTFSPMALYALPTVLFGFVFYNMKKDFSIASMLIPALVHHDLPADSIARKLAPLVDSLCLFSLCMGMSASLGTGILLLAGGLEKITHGRIPSNQTVWVICGIAIVSVFVISASLGLMRGIRLLSKLNSYFYLVLGLFIFTFGPTSYLLDLCVESFGAYLSDFFKISLRTSAAWGDGWSQRWPTFYWCVWLAWMPASSVFLGRISRGYTIREVLNVVFMLPSFFSVVWLVIFSGTAIHFELTGKGIHAAMQAGGIAAATYAVLENMPLTALTVPLFLLVALLSYVTSADANTNAIAGLCTKGITTQDSEPSVVQKFIWGTTIGALSIIMLVAFDIEGVKLLSYLGGFPSVFLMLLFMVGFVKIMMNPQKYDIY